MKIVKYKNEALIALLGLAAYAISVLNDFHTDDWLILNLLRNGLSTREFFSMETWARFRPLTNTFVYLRHLAFGDAPAGYYVLNMLLHAAFSVFLLRFLMRLGLNRTASTIAAALFAVYFPHYEAIIWLYGTIRILAAAFWVASLWALLNYLEDGRSRSLALFAVLSFLGYFVVEDFVVAPLGFFLFAFLAAKDRTLLGRLWPALLASLIGLAVYFALRSTLIVNPQVVEEYYYPGFHIFTQLWAYLEWMMIPPPDHSYFITLAQRLGPAATWIWNAASFLSAAGLVLALLYIIARAPKPIKFFALFIFIALLPALPLNYKVTSRNIYIPSIGLAALAGYFAGEMLARLEGAPMRRRLLIGTLAAYAAVSIAANWTASLEYRKHQTIVAGMIEDMRNSGRNLADYSYVLLDHMPGRAVVGPAMIYRLGYRHEVIASNDPVYGPVDIPKALREVRAKGEPYAVFDYRGGHLVDVTAEYSRADAVETPPAPNDR